MAKRKRKIKPLDFKNTKVRPPNKRKRRVRDVSNIDVSGFEESALPDKQERLVIVPKAKSDLSDVDESAMFDLGIPLRFVKLEKEDVPFERYVSFIESAVAGAQGDVLPGRLTVIDGPIDSGRDAIAFIITKNFRRARFLGYCLNGRKLKDEILSLDSLVDIHRLDFLVFYDVNPKTLSEFEAKFLSSATMEFLTNNKTVLLAVNDFSEMESNTYLGDLPAAAEHWGEVLPCDETWMPK